MNKNILTMGLICAAAFSLTSCNKELEPQAPVKEGVPFEIIASTGSTKTTNDGLNTKWASGDNVSVFHAEAGSKSYGSNDEFTYTSGDSFKGTLTEVLKDGKSYDWYVVYKYASIKSPASEDAAGGYTYVGNSKGVTQNGLNSTAHLSGTSCNMYGVAKNIAADQPVVVDMKHLTSVVKINVKNSSGADLTVSSVEFTAEEDIVGSYYINFTDGTPKYTASTGYVSNTAKLSAKSATIANGATAAFYIPIKPFTAASGDKLSISVNGHSKEKTLTSDVTFVAGTIHSLNFDYIKFPEINVSSSSIDVAKEGGDKSFTYTITNPIAGKSISAVASDSWINNIDLSTDGTVSLKVDANTGGARTGKITLSYEYANDVEVSVVQAGAIAYDYKLVESALADWRGDYLIAYSSTVFMDGSLAGGDKGVGKAQTHVNPGTSLSSDGKTVSEEWGNSHYVTIEAIDDADLSKGYVIKSHSSTTPYFYQSANSNGMKGTDNKSTAASYPIKIVFNSSSDIRINLGGGAAGAALRYNSVTGSTGEMFRFYKDAATQEKQKPIYLYKKAN
ncbi:MAG: fimbrillin family protein [Candidatus Cryptobacteroides sp.]